MPATPKPTFGLIAEGETDQNVIDSILAGFFDDPDFEARRLRPLTSAPADAPERFGGWPNVLQYIASPEFEEAFQLVDFVVVHIDTDDCEKYDVRKDDCEKYDVRKQEAGETLNTTDLVDRVVSNLKTRIGPDVWERVGARVVFAVVVDSIECWLLLLYLKAGDKTARAKLPRSSQQNSRKTKWKRQSAYRCQQQIAASIHAAWQRFR